MNNKLVKNQLAETEKIIKNYSKIFSQINNFSNEYQKMLIPLLKMDTFQQHISSVFFNLNESVQSLQKLFLAVNENYIQFIEHYKSVISSIGKSQFFINFLENFKENGAYSKAFRYGNWPLAPSMPNKLIREVVYFYDKKNKSAISNVISGYYRRNGYFNLCKMVRKWKNHPIIKNRMSIINTALDRHINKDYISSVPLLLNQIEGMLSVFVVENNLQAKLGRPKELAKITLGEYEQDTIFGKVISSILLFVINNNLYTYSDFQKEIRKKEKHVSLTRHTINHGISINYGTHVFSLKCFLIIDALDYMILKYYDDKTL